MALECAQKAVNAQKLRVTPGKRNYAENIYRVSGGKPLSEEEAVELAFNSWSRSEKYFDYKHPKPTAFSQMIWNGTNQLGTGVAQSGDKTAVCTTYYKRGNVVLVNNATNSDPGFFFKKNVFASEEKSEFDNASSSTTSSSATTTTVPSTENGASSTAANEASSTTENGASSTTEASPSSTTSAK